MKLLIPKIGTRIVLTKPWTFKLSDERRNENFWLSCHGEPKKKIYYYDPNNYYNGTSSPIPTAVCTRQGQSAADAIDTVVPAGTALFIESFHIQKGHEPKITFRIKKENKTKIGTGKFLATIDDINKMEVEAHFVSKYPNGRFVLRISEGVDRHKYQCTCSSGWRNCTCNHPHYTDKILVWDSDPESASRNGKHTAIRHRTDTAGLDEFTSKGYFRSSSEYSKTFDNLQACLNWASKKGFTQTHIDAFLKQYDPLRVEWEKSKA